MNKMLVTNGWDRRAFLAASGALVVAAGASGLYSKSALAEVSETRPPFTPDQLDSWLSIDKAGNVTAYFGKIDVGRESMSRYRRSSPRSSMSRCKASRSSWAIAT